MKVFQMVLADLKKRVHSVDEWKQEIRIDVSLCALYR